MAAEPDLRIAFHAPRASHLKPGESGDKVFVRTLLAELRARGHEIEIVSRVNARDFWRGHLPARRLIICRAVGHAPTGTDRATVPR